MKTIVKWIGLTILLLINSQGWAQADSATQEKFSFYATGQAALLEGAAGSAFAMQAVAGVQRGPWAGGLGAGIDKYGSRTIPLFLEIRRRLANKLPLWLYADGGINSPWKKEGAFGQQNSSRSYFDAGLQYQWELKQRQGPVVSLGYSEKRAGWKQSTSGGFCINGPCPETFNEMVFTYRRIVVKAGWRF